MKRVVKGLCAIIGVLAVAVVVLLAVQARQTANDVAPGLRDGALVACPESPNCVLSEAGTPQSHAIDPLQLPPDSGDRLPDRVAAAIAKMGGRLTPSSLENYYSATFESTVFGFVDDLELRFDGATGALHFRSASRVGESDFGVNRDRVETLRQLLTEQTSL